MSHRATNWAIQQRGLAPATKLVLWHLCDRHNPDYGCFPSQDQLAADAEISRASLNVHLDKLEQAGLIRRERRIDDDTKRQRTTRYFLGFEEGFALKPCPDSGHGSTPAPCPDFAKSRVQNLDTNPVSKEPVITTARDACATREGRPDDEGPDLDAAEAACLAACGEGMTPAARAAVTATTATIGAWLKAGFDLDLDVLPVIAERTAKAPGQPDPDVGLLQPGDRGAPCPADRPGGTVARGWGSWRWPCRRAWQPNRKPRGQVGALSRLAELGRLRAAQRRHEHPARCALAGGPCDRGHPARPPNLLIRPLPRRSPTLRLTPREIEDRLEEAAYTLRNLPEKDRPRGYGNSWPPVVHDAKHAYGYTPERSMRVIPSAAAISRMEECFHWLLMLNPEDARIVWLRAGGARWRQVCIRAGVVRSTA